MVRSGRDPFRYVRARRARAMHNFFLKIYENPRAVAVRAPCAMRHQSMVESADHAAPMHAPDSMQCPLLQCAASEFASVPSFDSFHIRWR